MSRLASALLARFILQDGLQARQSGSQELRGFTELQASRKGHIATNRSAWSRDRKCIEYGEFSKIHFRILHPASCVRRPASGVL